MLLNVFSKPTHAAFTGYNGKLIFYSNRSSVTGIFTLDQGTETKILGSPISVESPSAPVTWSPDGQYIYVSASNAGNDDIYRLDADGSNITRLTTATGSDYDLSLNADGTKILFRSSRDGKIELYIMDADGSNQTRVTNNNVSELTFSLSPDGTKIVFNDTRYGNDELFVINADGSNETRLTSNSALDIGGIFSPDGSKIVYFSRRDGHNEVYTINPDGSNDTRLTTSVSNAAGARWSHDSQTLYFQMDSDIYQMNSDGSNQIKLLETDGHSELAAIGVRHVSPDGKKLLLGTLFPAQIFSLDIASGAYQQLTTIGFNESGGFQPLPNTPPLTTGDTASVSFNTPKLIDVLGNDSDEEALPGGNLSITVQPSNGTTSVVDGKVRYTPSTGYQGSDSLTYRVCDVFLLNQKCAAGVVNVTVQAPTAPSLDVSTVNGEPYSPSTERYVTSNLRPTFSGTASPRAEITVKIHSNPIILTTAADSNGNWSVTPTFDLPSGKHMVYISATLNGLTTSLGVFGLTAGRLADTGGNLFAILVLGATMTVVSIRLLYMRQAIYQTTGVSR